jgi:hypothetical protein
MRLWNNMRTSRSESLARKRYEPAHGPAGSQLHLGRHGPQRVHTSGRRWSDRAETVFLDHLAATANVMASAKACGFTPQALYARRRKDAAFQQRWDAALAQGYAHIEALLVQRAIEALEGFEPDPATPIVIRDMTVKDAMILLGHHRRVVEGRPLTKRQKWQRHRPIEDTRAEIQRRIDAMQRARQIKTERAWATALTGQAPREVPTATNLRLAYRPGAPCKAD